MQRMLVGLVLVLVVAVAVLGAVVLGIQSDLATRPVRETVVPPVAERLPATPPASGVDPARVATLERLIRSLRGEVDDLRRRRASPPRPPVSDGESGADESDPKTLWERFGSPTEGEYEFSEEELGQFVALQKEVERRRRVDSNVTNTLRRIERLASRGEIGALRAEQQPDLERIIRTYAVAQVELSERYLRSPRGKIAERDHKERREQFQVEIEKAVESARVEMVEILGETDGSKVVENTLRTPYGVRPSRRGMRR